MEENGETDIVKNKKLKKKATIKEWIIDIAIVACIALFIWNFVGYGVWITSGSMIPTLGVKDRLIVTRVHDFDSLKEGDIVLFKQEEYNNDILIKRLIGLPGDKIEIKNGVVFRNGEQLQEDYVKNKDHSNGIYQVPQGKYFFLGDNRPNSSDSREWKNPYVDKSQIEGKARIKYYPVNQFEIYK
ncbi:signal peptidase I [Clostridium sp. C2-6-12]|uniref:signal peptidase I n=1 Tax=Clostridium sp. C2-6-12 TaxID=2698832 RepID=UPI001370458F|nr:signal peptidase I [Clostridium sp. C2-6-12]